MAADRTELHDLAAQQPEKVKELAREVGGVGEAGERAAVDLEAGLSLKRMTGRASGRQPDESLV